MSVEYVPDGENESYSSEKCPIRSSSVAEVNTTGVDVDEVEVATLSKEELDIPEKDASRHFPLPLEFCLVQVIVSTPVEVAIA